MKSGVFPFPMSLLKKLFGQSAESPEEREAKTVEKQFRLLTENGIRALQMNAIQTAIPYFEQALELRPNDLNTTGLLAEARLKAQDYEDALPLLARLVESGEADVEVKLLRADALGQTKRYSEMSAETKAIMAEYPEEARAACLSGIASRGLHNDIMAIADLTTALRLRPDYDRARLLRAEILGDMGQWSETLTDTEELIAHGNTEEETLLLHSRALASLERHDEALHTLQQIIETNPFCRAAYLQKGAIYEQTSQPGKAIETYDEALEQMKDFAEIYLRRGAVKRQLHNDEGAAEDLKRFLELRPEAVENVDGDFSNIENKMNEMYRYLNPYKF